MRILFLILVCFGINVVFASPLTLESSSIFAQETLDKKFTCDGENISPELEWSHIPKNTASFALIVSDPDAPTGTYYHWILFNIPKSVNKLAENLTQLPQGARLGLNSFEKMEYDGPCPPKGSEHHYIFNLYALDAILQVPEDADAAGLLQALQNHVVGTAELTVKYGR